MEVCADLSPHSAQCWQFYLLSGCQETPCSASSAQRSSSGKRCLWLPVPRAVKELNGCLCSWERWALRTEAGQTFTIQESLICGNLRESRLVIPTRTLESRFPPCWAPLLPCLALEKAVVLKHLLPVCSWGQELPLGSYVVTQRMQSSAKSGLFVTLGPPGSSAEAGKHHLPLPLRSTSLEYLSSHVLIFIEPFL